MPTIHNGASKEQTLSLTPVAADQGGAHRSSSATTAPGSLLVRVTLAGGAEWAPDEQSANKSARPWLSASTAG
jgi:hypothetical protein